MEEVELRPAHEWTCDNCGRINYCSGVVFEGSEEDKKTMRYELGIGEDEDGELVAAPEQVKCPHCNTEFETKEYGA